MRQKFGNILWGAAFIIAGVGIAGNVFDLWNVSLFFDGWWTLFIIVPCFISIIQYGFNTGNSIGLAVGGLLLLAAQDIIPPGIAAKMFFPVLLVIVGLAIIFRPAITKASYKSGNTKYTTSNKDGNAKYTTSDKEGDAKTEYSYTYTYNGPNDTQNWNTSCGSDIVAVFCGNNGSFNGRVFKGASATAVFGGVDVDLRGATIEGEATLNATAIFGGVDVFTDNNVQVVYRSVPVFGGVECSIPPRDKSLPTLYVNCVAIFGGVEIK